ncbi:glycoside hydrolase family 127 protein [Zunongwangia endophytica]|uniref:Beta-L-arabinofuranosidase domain-containing protein n=1 Tax=Zunongwangia endophytica TaxID=1808945 RepID=A0ABV8H638_9FLAO|nr:glycoside hydrolase family 127 protein [Zunongwangia endophytica]MDN3594267.1 glycoside hydrolase family 127 protein [Zunongwangia endophytica]
MKFRILSLKRTGLALGVMFLTSVTFAQQSKLSHFKLKDVKLQNSLFEEAMHTDLEYIMEMDPDRLLAPFLREAGLSPKAESYPNWENTGLDGHIGGHYLTALAQMYASAGSEEALERLNNMITELKKAQDANGNGYIGGIPESNRIWKEISEGNIKAGGFSLNDGWVPLYNIHKTYSGLRDAYLIAGNKEAKQMLIDLTDWMIDITSDLSENQIQEMLISEHGGLNETFADVYKITGEKKYLDLAYAFTQKEILQPLANNKDMLNGMHANTQIPKVIGFETIAALDDNQQYHNAASYFWKNVVNKRTVSIGGNSVREHFHPSDDFSSMINSVQGPETCNTYNMLKLSEKLFLANPEEKYINFYEQGLYNHILSSQHPEGGFVYFTPMRPDHYRVYSQPETSMWCCVGSGLENHGKYNQMIYTHSENELYVNLFIPSEVNWEDKNFKLIQTTEFPNSEETSFKIETQKPQKLIINLRYPSWAGNGFKVEVNGKKVKFDKKPGSYISINRKWKNGDQISMKLPMTISSERLPDGSNYESLKYGPIVLAAKTGKEDLKGLFADASRGGHIAEGEKIALSEAPMFVLNDIEDLTSKVTSNSTENLRFSVKDVLYPSTYSDLEFVPFYEVHDSRYAIYFPVETHKSLEAIQQKRKQQEIAERELEEATIDLVNPGEQQPESDHFIKSENSNAGVNKDRHWRDASGWFSYELQDENNEAARVQITYFGLDANRKFSILVNGEVIIKESLKGEKGEDFFTRDYQLPKKIIEQKNKTLTIRFEAEAGSRTAGIYGVRLMKKQ